MAPPTDEPDLMLFSNSLSFQNSDDTEPFLTWGEIPNNYSDAFAMSGGTNNPSEPPPSNSEQEEAVIVPKKAPRFTKTQHRNPKNMNDDYWKPSSFSAQDHPHDFAVPLHSSSIPVLTTTRLRGPKRVVPNIQNMNFLSPPSSVSTMDFSNLSSMYTYTYTTTTESPCETVNTNENSNLELPLDMARVIWQHCDIYTLLICAQTCRKWKVATEDQLLWKAMFRRDFSEAWLWYKEEERSDANLNWKAEYKKEFSSKKLTVFGFLNIW